ncbi:MAG: hypothetical protein EOP56_14140 [Sphingobacteriales bacterium]|nr:MAG: hypothetical protein EOP56_14140 [Sphingobacteriales bacterium]
MPIQINKPCTEQWDGMQPKADGRHCDKCCKTVIDFSTWETADIAAYLKQQAGKETCGRMNTEQVSVNAVTEKRSSIYKLWHDSVSLANKIAAMLLFALGFASVGCKQPKQIAECKDSSKLDINDSLKTYALGLMTLDIPDSSYRIISADSTNR